MRTTFFHIILALLIASCTNKNGNTDNARQNQDSDSVMRTEHANRDNANRDNANSDNANSDQANNVQSLSELLRDTKWYDTGYSFWLPYFMTPTTEIYVDEVPSSVQCWVYDDVCLACWSLLGVWAVTDYPAPDKYLTEDILIKSVTYHNSAGTIFSGYASDGRIWYMKKNITVGREIQHAKALILLYPKAKQDEVKTFIDIVRVW